MNDTSEPARPVSLNRTALYCVGAGSVEWYDFFLYATASATIFPSLFFADLGPTGATFASFLTFALAFVARPAGGLVFGWIGDRVGRRAALSAGTVGMGAATVLIGLLPPTATIGIAAPIIVVFCRLLQGLALGGEVGPATSLLIEAAPAGQRGLYASWQIASQGIAVAVGGMFGVALSLADRRLRFGAAARAKTCRVSLAQPAQ